MKDFLSIIFFVSGVSGHVIATNEYISVNIASWNAQFHCDPYNKDMAKERLETSTSQPMLDFVKEDVDVFLIQEYNKKGNKKV